MRQPQASDSVDAGGRAQSASAKALQAHDDQRPGLAGRGESLGSPAAEAPNQRWVGDTTEFVIGEGAKLYLAAILDLYSRFLVGWAISPVNDRHLTIKALEMALKRRAPHAGLWHHSDRGCTDASADYQAILDARGITCSMSRRGDCYDNAVMESFFSTVKSELADRFDSVGDATRALFDYLEVFYNRPIASATPFFLYGSGYREGTLFHWTMSDFSLMAGELTGFVRAALTERADRPTVEGKFSAVLCEEPI